MTDIRQRAAGEQSAYSLWVPRECEHAICVSYGRRLSDEFVTRLARHVHLAVPGQGRSIPDIDGPLDAALIVGHPAANGERDRSRALADYIETATRLWTLLRPSGVLMVAFDPAVSTAEGSASRLSAWARPRTWREQRAIEAALTRLPSALLTRVHVFPTVWRPLLMHTPGASTELKKLAASHAGGWRARALAATILREGRFSAFDLLPAGIVWIAGR